jgi:hypothetical protein
MKSIYQKLEDLDIVPDLYLRLIRSSARAHKRYDPARIFLSDKKPFKLYYLTPDDQKVYFGDCRYNDFFIYDILEHHKVVKEGEAIKRREMYKKRASKIRGDWYKDKFSKNSLALNILWQVHVIMNQ